LQIQDYLFAIRRRLWLPIAVPLAAAVITAGVLYIQPERYEATATVIVPALSGQGYSTSAVTQYVSTYKDVLVSEPVVRYVSLLTGEKEKDLVSGLSADTATASSNIITVTYIGPNRKTVTTVAESAAVQALDVLLGPQKARADQEVSSSLSALADANKALTDYRSETGDPDPIAQQKDLQQQIAQWSSQLQQVLLAGDQARAKGLRAILADYQQQFVDIAPIVVQYNELLQRQTAANAVYTRSLADQNKVGAEIASDHDAAAVSYRFVGHVSRVPDMLKFGGIALAIGLVLTIGFIVFMEFYRPAVAQVPYLRRLVEIFPSSEEVAPVEAESGAASSNGQSAEGARSRTSRL
jgi:uncharacterized protein involved in exopolysaccharide biosynthesis